MVDENHITVSHVHVENMRISTIKVPRHCFRYGYYPA